jgi:NAD(P)H-dependent flavin oxidoreductase YrpB (nitropropane dioxygenase family)
MLHTKVCDLLAVTHPIIQAGMSRSYTSADLVAAVSAAGGLGILGCLDRPASEAVAEIRRIRALTDRPFGVNFVLHRRDEQTFAACLDEGVPVFSFFRGDPEEATARVHATGGLVIHQITTVEEAKRALASGVDILIAQGTEAGGHNGPVPLLSLLPAVVDVAAGRPVLAAGGIVDGRGMAAALCLGADGVVMGTRFLATLESPAPAVHKQAILAAAPGATVASGIFDLLWGREWPGVTARALRNRFTARWVGRDGDLLGVRPQVLEATHQAEASGTPEEMILLAGEGAGRIHELLPAGEVVSGIAAAAARILSDWGSRLDHGA